MHNVLSQAEVNVMAAALCEQHELREPFRTIADRVPTVDDAMKVQLHLPRNHTPHAFQQAMRLIVFLPAADDLIEGDLLGVGDTLLEVLERSTVIQIRAYRMPRPTQLVRVRFDNSYEPLTDTVQAEEP